MITEFTSCEKLWALPTILVEIDTLALQRCQIRAPRFQVAIAGGFASIGRPSVHMDPLHMAAMQ